ncbi:PREDICTED: cuticle protein 19.8 [Nicrophorus vespilloides]|uniref:Cuticle protein 19.8 n=1 Tax=Nicrophorus vespilloides TaxID=110193 RepID=A0ABM1M1M0_NICVS|nr:PREDICTED: cuticle protein 19.8 [Nicrophorus vespilloides]
MKTTLIFLAFFGVAFCDVIHILEEPTTPAPPPKPYAFGYAAGRFPGHIDRTHTEISDGHTIQGAYSYVDPSHKIRTVEYIADKNGFHPTLINPVPSDLPKDSAAVSAAKEKHLQQFNTIAANHQAGYIAIPRDSAAVAHAKEAHLNRYNAIAEAHRVVPGQVIVPLNTAAVQRASDKHHNLFVQIAADHARIAAEREAEKLAEEATAQPIHY